MRKKKHPKPLSVLGQVVVHFNVHLYPHRPLCKNSVVTLRCPSVVNWLL